MAVSCGMAFALGKHMTLEYYECDCHVLADAARVKEVFLRAARASGATVISAEFHDFKPQGVSGVVVISESHFAVHAWPEHDYAAVDIFTCGETISFETAAESLKQGLGAQEMIISSVMNRGIPGNNGIERMVPICEDRTHRYTLSWETQFRESNAWGLLTSIDVYNCSESLIRDERAIRRFVRDLCEKSHMNIQGDTQVAHFGVNPGSEGFSMIQMVDNCLISGHFIHTKGAVYLDILSCIYYEPRDVAEFATAFFGGSNYRMQVALRR